MQTIAKAASNTLNVEPVASSRVSDYSLTRLHIVIVSETLPPDINGVAMTMGKLITQLKNHGHRVDLVYPELSGKKNEPSDPEAEHNSVFARCEDIVVRGYPIPFYKSMKFGLSGTRVFLKKWKTHRPDIVHIVTEGPLGVAALLAARKLRLPIASGFHTNFHQYTSHYKLGTLNNCVMQYLRWFHNKTDVTFVPTGSLSSELTKGGIVNTRVLSRGVDTTFFSPVHRCTTLRQSYGATDNDPVLLYVGRVAPEKNVGLAIRAFERFRKIQSNAKLVFVGDGPLLEYVKNHPTRPIVCGSRTGKDLARYYASADIFLFPSLSETFGNVTLEAMASGLAVVAFDYAAAKEHINNKINGMSVTPDCETSYIHAVESLAGQPLLTKSLGIKARSSVKDFDWGDIYRNLINMYQDLHNRIH